MLFAHGGNQTLISDAAHAFIATNYKMVLQQALEDVEVQMGDVDRKLIYAHPSFVEPMLDYIVTDFEKSRSALNDASIGGMVICDSAPVG